MADFVREFEKVFVGKDINLKRLKWAMYCAQSCTYCSQSYLCCAQSCTYCIRAFPAFLNIEIQKIMFLLFSPYVLDIFTQLLCYSSSLACTILVLHVPHQSSTYCTQAVCSPATGFQASKPTSIDGWDGWNGGRVGPHFFAHVLQTI